MRRCRVFDYHGCEKTMNNFQTYDDCMTSCMPVEMEKRRLMSKARMASSTTMEKDHSMNNHQEKPSDLSNNEWQKINNMWGPKQDCILSSWSAWSPCLCKQTQSKIAISWRWRNIEKPSMNNGLPCKHLFEQKECTNCE